MKTIKVIIEMIKINILGRMEYRAEFLSMFVAQFISYGFDFLMVWIMIRKFETMGTWNALEVVLLYSINLCSYGLAGFFFYNTSSRLPEMIRNGDFDEVLIRPISPFSYLLGRHFNFGYVSHICLSILMIIICFVKLGVGLTLINIIFLIIMLISGALIQSSLFLYVTVPCFWMVKASAFRQFLFVVKGYVQYPISIYNKFIQVLLTLIIPFAFINFYPAQFFLKKNDFLLFHPVLQYLSPVVGAIMFTIAYNLWQVGVRNYTSTGS